VAVALTEEEESKLIYKCNRGPTDKLISQSHLQPSKAGTEGDSDFSTRIIYLIHKEGAVTSNGNSSNGKKF